MYKIYFNGASFYVSMYSKSIFHLLEPYFNKNAQEVHKRCDNLNIKFKQKQLSQDLK